MLESGQAVLSGEAVDSGAAVDPTAAVDAANDVAQGVVYHLSQSDVDSLFTLMSGLLSVQWFSLVAQLMTLGAVLVVVFVIAMRRF